MQTKEEIKKLKNDWLEDPCWDIEQTEGFSKHKKELLIFSLTKQLEWANERIKKLENFRQTIQEFLEIDEMKEKLKELPNG